MIINSNKFFPKFYILNREISFESGGDCDCGVYVEWMGGKVPTVSSVEPWNDTRNSFDTPHTISNKLIVIPVNDYFLVFNRIQGVFLVLNRDGFELFKLFKKPVSINSVIQNISMPIDTLTYFFSNFIAAGLLNEVGKDKSAPLISSDSDVLTSWLHLTNQCNLRCQYCYVNKSSQYMSKHTAKRAVETVFATAVSGKYKQVTLKYAGGEPTLNAHILIQAHFLAEELATIQKLKLEGHILTNGVVIPDELAELSLHYNLKWVISLDGLGAAHNKQRPLLNGKSSSKQILASIDKLKNLGISPHISITLTRYNLEQLPSLVRFLLEQQLRFSINFYRQNGHSGERVGFYPSNDNLILALRKAYAIIEQNLPDYSLLSLLLDRVDLSTPHAYSCAAGRHYMVVGHRSNIAPCQMLVSQPSELSMRTDLPIIPVSQSEKFKNFAVTERKGCASDCPWRYYCAGGCPLEAFQSYGRYDMNSPYCEVYRTLIPEVLRLEALRLLKYSN